MKEAAFSAAETALVSWFAKVGTGKGEDPLGWIPQKRWREPPFAEPTDLCASLMGEMRRRGAFLEEDLRVAARKIAAIDLKGLDLEEDAPEPPMGEEFAAGARALAELAGRDRQSERGRPLREGSRWRGGFLRAARGKAQALNFALRVSEDPEKMREAIREGLRASQDPWTPLLAPWGIGASWSEPEPGGSEAERLASARAWRARGAELLARMGAAAQREMASQAKGSGDWAKASEEIFGKEALSGASMLEGLERMGFGDLLSGPAGAGREFSAFCGALAGAAPGREMALRLALRDPRGLREALSEKKALLRLFGCARELSQQDLASRRMRVFGIGEVREQRAAFLESAARLGALPDRLPEIEPADLAPLERAAEDKDLALDALDLLEFASERGNPRLWGEPGPAEIARCASPSAFELFMRLGGEGRIPEALEAWIDRERERARANPSLGMEGEAARKLPMLLEALGERGAIDPNLRMRMWIGALRDGAIRAGEALAFEPGEDARREDLLELALALSGTGKGLGPNERFGSDAAGGRMIDKLLASRSFRSALAQARGKRGMGHFSAFRAFGIRVIGKVGGADKEARLARLESLSLEAKVKEEAPAAPKPRRGL